jgi:hypothetical protein
MFCICSSFSCLEHMSDLVWKKHCNYEVFGLNYSVTLNNEINFYESKYIWCRVNDLGCRIHNSFLF